MTIGINTIPVYRYREKFIANKSRKKEKKEKPKQIKQYSMLLPHIELQKNY